MKKCLRIKIHADIPKSLLSDFIKKNAHTFQIEGSVQVVGVREIRIVACGKKDAVEEFIDALYDGYEKWVPEEMEVEPFLKSQDYRGIFRIIE